MHAHSPCHNLPLRVQLVTECSTRFARSTHRVPAYLRARTRALRAGHIRMAPNLLLRPQRSMRATCAPLAPATPGRIRAPRKNLVRDAVGHGASYPLVGHRVVILSLEIVSTKMVSRASSLKARVQNAARARVELPLRPPLKCPRGTPEADCAN